MAVISVQLRIPHASGISEDAVVNTFHFSGVDNREDMVSPIIGRLKAFYNTVPDGSTYAVNRWLSGELNLPGARAKFYDLDDPEPRAPFADESPALVQGSAGSAANLPGEVALCTSYRGPLVSGQVAARRRGRLYIGPLNVSAADGQTTAPARPLAAFRTALAGATQELAAASTLGARWVVYSRVNSSAVGIEYGWVDNAFDTQRRRGVAPTSRVNWSVEIP